MKRVYYFFLLLIICGSYLSCKKETSPGNNPGNPPTPGTPSIFGTKEIEIIVPSGSSFKPAGSKVFSFGTEQTADASGKAKVTFENGSSTLAYVFDTNQKLILAGFITDSTNVISPATTAKVLLYLGYNIPLQPDTLSAYFLNNIDKLQGAKDWQKDFETLFLSDPLTLSNKGFVAPLKARMAKMIDQTPPVDIRAKAADIHVDANDVRSGIQVSDDGLSKFKIINNYRRRTHAFLYKMSFKDMNGASTNVKLTIDAGTKADMDMAVSPVSAVSGFLSEIGKNIEGKGLESFSVTSGPFALELRDNESEALYKVRVVGPGGPSRLQLTADEVKKEALLEMETFLADLVIPIIGLATSRPKKDAFGGISVSTDAYANADAMLTFVKAMPDVYDEIKQGNYQTALIKLMENVLKDVGGSLLNELYGIALGERLNGNVKTFFTNNFKQLLAVLQVTDFALGASDLVRIATHLKSSYWLEEWDIKANAGLVTLTPDRLVVVPFQQQKITAAIKNLTQTASYEWSTSGKYGKLTDTKGHTDLASFTSSDKDVFYVSRASAASLSAGDNFEYIYVTAFAGGVKVGTDTAVINVKKDRYAMKPDGITVSGKAGSQHEVRMYLEKPDGSNNIKPNNDVSYKVIWTTAGAFGKLNAKDITGVKTLTLYDDNSAYYECLDKDTKTGTETITARIYSKAKSAPESEYKLFDEVKGTVKIDNDPKKRILHLPVVELHDDTTSFVGNQQGYNCAKVWAASFAEDKDAQSYTIMFYAGKNIGNQIYSWLPGAPTPAPPVGWSRSKGYQGGIFTITWIGTLNTAGGWSPAHANGAPASGKAQVTIFLK